MHIGRGSEKFVGNVCRTAVRVFVRRQTASERKWRPAEKVDIGLTGESGETCPARPPKMANTWTQQHTAGPSVKYFAGFPNSRPF
jgi:hypothetical protein